MSYKVYLGEGKDGKVNVTDPVTGETYTSGFVWVGKTVIYDSCGDAEWLGGADTPTLLDPQLDQEKNTIDTFTFTMTALPMKNPGYDKVKLRKSFVLVEQDGEAIWMGYVSKIETQFDLSINVTASNILGLLNTKTSIVKPTTYLLTTGSSSGESLWYQLLFDTEPDWIHPGKVTMLIGKTVDLSDSGYTAVSGFDGIQQYFTDEYDGYLRLRYMKDASANGLAVALDYLDGISEVTEQEIRYGSNLMTLDKTMTLPSEFCNRVLAYRNVTEKKGWWIFKTAETKMVSGASQDEDSVAKYGVVEKTIFPDSGTTVEQMQKAAYEELVKQTSEPEPELNAEAVDLADAGEAADHLRFMKKTRIVSEPHGVDMTLVCTRTSIPLDDPASGTYSYGLVPKKLTDQQNTLVRQMAEYMKKTAGLMGNANG